MESIVFSLDVSIHDLLDLLISSIFESDASCMSSLVSVDPSR